MQEKNHTIQPKKNEKTVAYSALTLVLLVFLLQASFGMIVNILRNFDTFAKLKIVSNAHKYARTRNYNLRYEMQSFNSAKNLESIARNNLKMAAPDEILLVISQPQPQEKKAEKEDNKPKEKGIFFKER